ncbi:MAG TPA: DUF362 domain-containing protein [Candidatus Marinimicrobia bacterium]|nr:DUF362 domain-containing protein [Candidatus Neomarinimicrobiota bacterium]
MKSRVVVLRCEDYDYLRVKRTIEKGLELLGGAGKFVEKGERILLKPNLLKASPPEKGVTTHPSVFRAVAEVLKDKGVKLAFGDSPGFVKPYRAAEKAGLVKIAKELDIEFADFENGQPVYFSRGRQNKNFTIATGVLESDGVISLPKFKTHQLTGITCAVKNQFGCIPGILKPEFHVKLTTPEEFSKMLVDLTMLIKPRLYIVDAVEAMEGNGPGAGDIFHMGLILISDDPVAVDSVLCHIINLEPDRVFTNRYGQEFGLGVADIDNIEILGDSLNNFYAPDFDVNRGVPLGKAQLVKFNLLRNMLLNRPVIDYDSCKRCGICIEQCSVRPKAVFWKDGNPSMYPEFDYRVCIRCFCCQEACPYDAIFVKVPLLRKIIDWFNS